MCVMLCLTLFANLRLVFIRRILNAAFVPSVDSNVLYITHMLTFQYKCSYITLFSEGHGICLTSRTHSIKCVLHASMRTNRDVSGLNKCESPDVVPTLIPENLWFCYPLCD